MMMMREKRILTNLLVIPPENKLLIKVAKKNEVVENKQTPKSKMNGQKNETPKSQKKQKTESPQPVKQDKKPATPAPKKETKQDNKNDTPVTKKIRKISSYRTEGHQTD